MSAIRPLATIAILAALGVFLAHRIQQEPLATTASMDDGWGDAPAYGDGAAGGEAPAFGQAPSFGDTPSFGEAPKLEPLTAPATPSATESGLPPLPTLPTADPSTASAPPAGSSPSGPTAVDPSQLNLPDLPLPANIPQANYSGSPAGAKGTIYGRVPSLGTATPDYPPTSPAAPATNPQANYNASPPAFPTAPTPSDSATTPSPTTPSIDSPTTPASGYAAARPAIQAALDRDELGRAHLLLSQWYGDPALSADERREVDRLLSQLAGSVIYSNEHRLEPPHQVQPGETLETIAKQYNTPWQLLAKINGVPRADAVEPGQILKVVRGPFKAVVDLSDAELYLTTAGRYAGRFPVMIEGAATTEGALQVAAKEMQYQPGSPAAGPDGYAKSIKLANPSNPSGQTIEIGAGGTPISVAASDLGDLFDILSEGSEVTIRR